MLDDRVRTSDADREQVTAQLRDHFAEGRLTHEELDERISAALSAKTFGELRQVLTDLPGPKLAAYQPKRPTSSPGPQFRPPVMYRHRPRLFPLVLLALLAVVLFSGAGAAVLALKVVTVIAIFMMLAVAAAAFAGAMFFRRVRKQWTQQFDGEGLGSWAERFGADRFGSGQFKFQSWEWPQKHHHHHQHHQHHHPRWSRDSDRWDQ